MSRLVYDRSEKLDDGRLVDVYVDEETGDEHRRILGGEWL